MVTPAVSETETISAGKLPRCYLLELPSELRNCITQLAIIDETSTTPFVTIHDKDFQGAKQPSIAFMCHQLRAEALPLFYGQNTFCLYGIDAQRWKDCKLWLKAIQKHTHLLQAVNMYFCTTHQAHLEIRITPNSKISHQVKAEPCYYADPREKCPVVEAGQESRYELQRIFDDPGQSGFTAEALIRAGNLMFAGDTRYWCDEGERERLVEAIIWCEMTGTWDGDDDD